ncbi:TPA: hypothetical protein N3A45_000218 [Salmonella enterica subsp. salamae serovar [1],40:z35:e,n,x,z15]|nr:hypothetical protein [Salmonella enterica]EHM1752888.1 hypothetical protein [Salmonella enterica subsp. salamae serovar 40:c:e,n,x,z15]EIU8980328.1 hypothetical protein [Salmonella enterica]HCL5346687.1 hypothetical protein [Salmonella enterica]HCM1997202.1 hypothetical protein [Salmonella enterica subsp. salamae serovar [1],40:z35:e,n,x,z15]
MSIQKKMTLLFKAIVDEMYENKEFARRIEDIFGNDTELSPRKKSVRRNKAIIDPIEIYRQSNKQNLEVELSKLDIEQLKDIVAEYGMDSQKLIMKWKQKEKIANKIVEITQSRAEKGTAFLKASDTNISIQDNNLDDENN